MKRFLYFTLVSLTACSIETITSPYEQVPPTEPGVDAGVPDAPVVQTPDARADANSAASTDASEAATVEAGGDASEAGPPDAGPTCTGCVLLASRVRYRRGGFVVSGNRLYWEEGGYGQAWSMKTDGTGLAQYGNATTCWQQRISHRVYGGYIYAFLYHSDASIRALVRMRLDDPSTNCETVFTPGYQSSAPGVLVPADDALYFNYRPDTNNSYTLARFGFTSLAATTIAASELDPRVADGAELFGTTNPGHGSGSYRIVRANKTTGAATELATFVVLPSVIGVDATWVYYVSQGTLYKVPRAATGPTTPTVHAGPMDLIGMEGTDFVWRQTYGSTLWRQPIAGGTTTARTFGTHAIAVLIHDATHYYFMVPNGSTDYDLYKAPL